MIVMFGSIIFFCEQGRYTVTAAHPFGAYYREGLPGQPPEVSPFSSIALAFYWVVSFDVSEWGLP